jgi:hypothetical protein
MKGRRLLSPSFGSDRSKRHQWPSTQQLENQRRLWPIVDRQERTIRAV